jgi:tetratricopeptide (TPR) repeat protein
MRIISINQLTVTLILLVCSSSVVAQQISGQVRYLDTGQAAFNVLVKCDGSGARVEDLTDRNGNFRFKVTPGHYTISIHTPGYVNEERSFDLVDNFASEYLLIRLKPDGIGVKPAVASTIDVNVPVEAQREFDRAQALLDTAKKEKVQEGIGHLEKAVQLYPKFLQAQLKIGTAYMDLAEWDKGEAALKKALEIEPTAANALFALGEVYLHQKKDEEAEKVLLQGLALETRSYQGHLTLARVYWDVGLKFKEETQWRPWMEKAYNQVNESLKLNPDLAQAHLVKGNLYLKVGRAKDAAHEFEEYLRLDPNGPFAQQTRTNLEKIKKVIAANP